MIIVSDTAIGKDDLDNRHAEIRPDRQRSMSASTYERAKRLFDIACSVLLLISAMPAMLLIAVAVKSTGPGPVIFKQRRVGKEGVEFWFYKFRSMTVDSAAVRTNLAEHNQHGYDSVTFKIKNDPRITKIGRLIRKTSLDELPQIWNVLRGDMSLVGPRPALPSEVARYTKTQRQRLAVIPGLTCFWQIRGRADLSFEQQVNLDLEYIEQRTFWLDFCLLVKTLPALISGRGAY